MLKKFKRQIIITSIVTLLPMVIGILCWEQLPEMVATHFGTDNQPDGWSSRGFAVFGLPVFMLVVHLLCTICTTADPKMKEKGIQDKIFGLILWTCPVISLVCCCMTYGYALGMSLDISTICMILVGAMFLIVGNYLPKCQQSYTIGIKLPWTLESEENWAKTHRLAGFLWIICGLGFFIALFFKAYWFLWVAFPVAVFIPTIYSYCLYKKAGK